MMISVILNNIAPRDETAHAVRDQIDIGIGIKFFHSWEKEF